LPDERASTIALQPHTRTLLDVLRTERVLQIILVVTFAANLGSGGMSEVALPALAHGPFHAGAAGYGALIAAFGGGALIGTIVAGQIRAFRRPAVVGSIAFLVDAMFLVIVPYLGGPIPAGAALAVGGALNGFGNILTITAFQRWAPPELLGRLMGVLLLCSFGIFPVSVALGGLVVHDFGPAPFFPVAAGILAIAVIAGLTQRPWRQFGSGPGS
jgi:predicted MFS family arabinose efflux permease